MLLARLPHTAPAACHAPNSPLAPAVRRYLSQARASARDSTGAYKPEAAYPQPLREPSPPALDTAFPYQPEAVPMLRWAITTDPGDGAAALYLGHLLFHLGRHAEARDLWKRAAELGAQPVIAWRALGMAARTLDGDLSAARQWLEKAAQADPKDAIVARDLATVLFDLADKAPSDSEKHDLFIQARDRLRASFDTGKGRSDFVTCSDAPRTGWATSPRRRACLTACASPSGKAPMKYTTCSSRPTWPWARPISRPAAPPTPSSEFDRALDYPDNLATGKVENAPQAHIQYQRGNALAALARKDQAIAAWKLAAAEPPSKDTRIEDARQKAKQALDKSIR